MAVASLSPRSTLYTYLEDTNCTGVSLLKELGIELKCLTRHSGIVFSYFHPLSTPHIQPCLDKITQCKTIQVSGEAVLRFGFIEGDAIINAHRAVYDPQSWRNRAQFHENGSTAKELAIVLNKLELRSATGIDDKNLAASHIIDSQQASVVIVKDGIWGATVFERDREAIHIPAYRSSRVFKIGTGDVFSAIFAYHWAEKGMPAAYSSDIASRYVSAYCGTNRLQNDIGILNNFAPVRCDTSGTVALEGAIDTIGQRYTMEEARYVLSELGIEVTSLVLDDGPGGNATAMLVLSDGLNDEIAERVQRAMDDGMPIVVLHENNNLLPSIPPSDENVVIANDFTSAIYLAAWAAAERRINPQK